MTNIYNLFKFIEDKEGKKPDAGRAFKLKLIYAPEELSPEDLKVDDHLNLRGVSIKSLPKGLQVTGNLVIYNLESSVVLDGLRVGGDLILMSGKKLSLPSNLQVGGSINLQNSEIISIPGDLKINSSLILDDASIDSLPDNLKVPKDLSLVKVKTLKTLPDNLQVGGNLLLNDSSIESLPNSLKVEGSLSLNRSSIKSLPNNLKVGGNLYLNSTEITSLPNNLKVVGHLNLSSTKITSLPESLKVSGYINITNISGLKPEDIPESLRSKINWGGGTWDDFNMYTNLPEIDIPTLGTVKGAKIDFAENKEQISKRSKGVTEFIEKSQPEKIEAYAAYILDWGSVTISYVLVIQLPGIPSPFIINTKDYTIKHKSKTLKLDTFASDITGRGLDAALSRLIPGYSKQEIPKHLQNEKGKLLRLSQIVDKEQQPVSMNLGKKKREGLGVKGQYKDYALAFSPDTQNIVVRLGRKLNIEWKDFIAYRHNGFGDVNYVIRGENPDRETYYLNKQGSGQGSTIKLYNKDFKSI
jgi:hypothetical protein